MKNKIILRNVDRGKDTQIYITTDLSHYDFCFAPRRNNTKGEELAEAKSGKLKQNSAWETCLFGDGLASYMERESSSEEACGHWVSGKFRLLGSTTGPLKSKMLFLVGSS